MRRQLAIATIQRAIDAQNQWSIRDVAKAIKLFPKVVGSPEAHDFEQEPLRSIAVVNDGEIGEHQSPKGFERFRFADDVPLQACSREIASEALFDPAVVLSRWLAVSDGVTRAQMRAHFPSSKHAARGKIEAVAP